MEDVVLRRREDETRRAPVHNGRGHRRRQPGDVLAGAVEGVEHAIEGDTHLVRQRVASIVVRPFRRTARIREVVRVILWLEHVEHVGPERLRRVHDIRARRIRLAAHGEVLRRAIHRDAHVPQRVHELRGGREVGLIRGDYVAARITVRRVVQYTVVERRLDDGDFAIGSRRDTLTRRGATAAGAVPRRRSSAPRRFAGGWRVAGLRRAAAIGDLRGGLLQPLDVMPRHRPRILFAALDRVHPHPPDVEQERLAVA